MFRMGGRYGKYGKAEFYRRGRQGKVFGVTGLVRLLGMKRKYTGMQGRVINNNKKWCGWCLLPIPVDISTPADIPHNSLNQRFIWSLSVVN